MLLQCYDNEHLTELELAEVMRKLNKVLFVHNIKTVLHLTFAYLKEQLNGTLWIKILQ